MAPEEKMWYYVENGQPEGPVSESALLAALDRLGFDTLVWTTGMSAWAPASEAGLHRPAPPPEPLPEPVPQPVLEPVAPPPEAALSGEPSIEPQVQAEPSAPGAPAAWGLVGTSGPAAGVTFPLAGRMTIGRSPQSDICIADDALSRNHAVIELTPQGCFITDSGSTNGTYVNGTRITRPTALKNGDVIVCGAGELRVSGPPPAEEKVPERTVALSLEQRQQILRALGREQPGAQASPSLPPTVQQPRASATCPHCGSPLSGPGRFCVFCGGAIQQE